MSEKCQVCGSGKVTHYKQRRKDGVWVVTARCENGHIPIKGKPFYPLYLFDIKSLPVLPIQESTIEQEEMFKVREVKQVWNPEPIKKYPSMPKPKLNGRNFPLPIEEK